MLTRRAKCAIVRRVFLIGGTVAAVTLALWQQSPLYRVESVDFANRQKEEPGWTGRRQEPLKDYVAGRTEGRLLHRADRAWLVVYEDLARDGQHRFFLPAWPPVNELAGAFEGDFTYIALECDGQTHYLGVTTWHPGDFPVAPAHLRYLWRRFASLVFLVGLLGYLLIPWPKRDPDAVAYARFTGALLPDLGLGMMFVGVFFALPWLIVSCQAGTSHPLILDGGWIVLTLILWGFCLFGLAIHAVAAWYEAWCIRIAGDHLVMESIRGVERVPFADIVRLTHVVREPPRALIRAGLLISLLNWRAAGPTLLVASRSDPVLCLIARDGRRWTFGLTGIRNAERLIDVLQQAGIAVDPDPVL